jgi:uncharacterized protein YkwD
MQPLSPTRLMSIVLLFTMTGASSSGQDAGGQQKTDGKAPTAPADSDPKPGDKDPPVDPIVAALVESHNRNRADAKLPPLKANPQLTQAALDHARDMAANNNLSHEGSDGSDVAKRVKKRGYLYEEIGENIADGQVSVEEVMRTWMNSPPHKENILANFTEMGAAVVPDGSGRKYWCVDFGRPLPKVDTAKGPSALIAALNKARTDARLPTVKADPKLTQVADRFVRDLAARKKVATKNSDGQTPFDILKRQNYHARQFGLTLSSGESDPAKVVASCLERQDERDQLLATYDRVGVAVAVDTDGTPYWVMILTQTQ